MVPGTCEWIKSNESYQTWLYGNDDNDGDGRNNDNTRLLWISGEPGKGKTMLSVFLTRELEEHTAGLDNAELAFFFCSAQDKKRNTAVAVLRGLVHQIISKRPQLVKHALPYFETPERTQQSLSSLETLWVIFSKLVTDAGLGTMFCVLDGLDECEESMMKVLLRRIVDLLASTTPSLTTATFRLAIVSRNMPDFQGCTRIRLDPDNDENVTSDIELFVSARVGELSRIEGFDDDFRASVQSTLLKRAGGTFLWVGFAMQELQRKQTCTEILEALEELPKGLPAVYSRMVLRIPAKHREMSRAILSWVTLAFRPLQIGELAALAARATAERLLAPSFRVIENHTTRDAITHCGPLLKVQGQEVSLVHQSARDYLLSDAVPEDFRLRQQPEHLWLAKQCLDCISRSELKSRAIDPTNEPDCLESPLLLQYAVLHWPDHAWSCHALAARLLDSHRGFLRDESSLRFHWWNTYRKMPNVSYCLARFPPLLHMLCILEITPLVKATLAKRSRSRSRSRRRGFHWHFTRHGNQHVSQHVNEKDPGGYTPLHWAALQGNEALVRLLLKRRADLEAENPRGCTALHMAVEQGHEALVQLLLVRKKGANIRAKDKSGQTALHFAASQGNEALVHLLRKKGANIKAQDKRGHTALHYAAAQGNEAVVQQLVDNGADIEAKTNYGHTALHYAALEGNETVVQLLVENGADVRAKTNYGDTVLHFAAEQGSEAMVWMLVEKGADVQAENSNGETVLHYAAQSGNEAVERLLVDLGADDETNDDETEDE